MHARAWLDPVFQNEYQAAPHPSCPACHAPLADANGGRVADDARAGITCAVCHVRAQTVFAAGSAGHSAGLAAAAHPTESLPLLAESAFCAPCHQFHFPSVSDDDEGTPYNPERWLQNTYNEWTRSQAGASGVQCQHCHMPKVEDRSGRSHRSHRFPGMRSRELVSSALHVTSDTRLDDDYVVLRLHLQGANIGHALPTGDMFRQLVVKAWLGDRADAGAREVLRRWFAPVRRVAPDGTIRYLLDERSDTRILPPGAGPGTTVELRLPAQGLAIHRSGQRSRLFINWRITLWAREPRSVLLRDVPADLARTVVQQGRVPLPY